MPETKSKSAAKGPRRRRLISPAFAMKLNMAIASRVAATLSAAAESGLITGAKTKRVSARAHERLYEAASARSGLDGNDLVEYALAKVALEDDFAQRLLARAGTIDPDLDLGI